jgi:hypothetical protein
MDFLSSVDFLVVSSDPVFFDATAAHPGMSTLWYYNEKTGEIDAQIPDVWCLLNYFKERSDSKIPLPPEMYYFQQVNPKKLYM